MSLDMMHPPPPKYTYLPVTALVSFDDIPKDLSSKLLPKLSEIYRIGAGGNGNGDGDGDVSLMNGSSSSFVTSETDQQIIVTILGTHTYVYLYIHISADPQLVGDGV